MRSSIGGIGGPKEQNPHAIRWTRGNRLCIQLPSERRKSDRGRGRIGIETAFQKQHVWHGAPEDADLLPSPVDDKICAHFTYLRVLWIGPLWAIFAHGATTYSCSAAERYLA